MRLFLMGVLIAVSPWAAWASGLNSLAEFVKTVKTGQASFTQVVTSPAKEGQVARVKTSRGQFEFARPHRFRFDYLKPFVQTIVADGQTLWLFDADLNQVTARQQSQVLGSTPAALIASAADLQALQADFTLTDAPDKDGLQWVLAVPRAQDGQLQSVRIGFAPHPATPGAPATLQVLEIRDSFGQHSVLRFADFRVNPDVSPEVFKFKPPAGADVLRQ